MTLSPQSWLGNQHSQQRQVFLVIDRLADPDPLVQLFQHEAVRDCVNLYQDSEIADMAEIGPWLILPNSTAALASLLDQPQQNWGWLGSVDKLDMSALAEHWKNRSVVHENCQRCLYRFQDNRVIARHLQALQPDQLPQLLGPITSVLAWQADAWQAFDNPAPALLPQPRETPWLELAEPETTERAIRQHNLLQWLWQQHPAATARLAEQQPLEAWLNQHLEMAEHWGWRRREQLHFLLAHQLMGTFANQPGWLPASGETVEAHFSRCQQTFPACTTTQGLVS